MKTLNTGDTKLGAQSAPDIVISSTPPAVQKVTNGTAGGKAADTKVNTSAAKDDKKKDGMSKAYFLFFFYFSFIFLLISFY